MSASILTSREIYRGQSGPTPYLSNRARARLMKETFLDDLGVAAKADKSDERRARSGAEIPRELRGLRCSPRRRDSTAC